MSFRYDLPENWIWVQLGNVSQLERGITFPASDKEPKKTNENIACLTTGNIQEETVWTDVTYVPQKYVRDESKLLRTGDILISIANSRALVGKVSFVEKLPFAATLGGFNSIIRSKPTLVVPHYLFYFLRSRLAQEWFGRVASQTVNIANLNTSDILATFIPLPPLPEQERIVAILREADDLRRQQQAALATAQTLIPALFHHMFGEQHQQLHSAGNGKMLGEFVEVTSSLVDPQSPEYRKLYHVGSDNIESESGNLIELSTIEEVGAISGKFLFTPKNILYSKIRPALRKVATPDFTGLCSADIYPLSYDSSQVSKQYLSQLLRSEHFTTYVARVSGRAQIPKVNRTDLLKYRTILPDMALQLDFEQQAQEVIQIQKTFQDSFDTFDSLLHSVLIRAFTGELSENFRLVNRISLETSAIERDTLLGHVRHLAAPVVAEPTGVAQVLNGRNSLARSLSQPQQTLLQTIVAYVQENGRRYFTLPGFLADHSGIPANAVRQNVELFEKVGLLTRVSRQVEPEGIPYFETFYRLTTPLEQT